MTASSAITNKILRAFLFCTSGILIFSFFVVAAFAAKETGNVYWPSGTKPAALITADGNIQVTWEPAVIVTGNLSYRVAAYVKGVNFVNVDLGPDSTSTVLPPPPNGGSVAIHVIAFSDAGGSVSIRKRIHYPK